MRNCGSTTALQCAVLLGCVLEWVGLANAATASAAPKNVMVTPGDQTVTLEWETIPEARGYTVKRATATAGPFVDVVTGLVTSKFIDDGLTNGRNYFFVVAAANAEGETSEAVPLGATPSAAVLDVLPAGAKIERLATGFGFVEGPVWIPTDGGSLVFSDLGNNRLQQWRVGGGVTVFRANSGNANGNTLDREGRLLTCEHNNRRVSRTEKDGTVVTLVNRYNARTLNAPNDLVVKSDGTVWFTDPNYGQGQTQPGRYVYRFDPEIGTNSLVTVVTNFDQPNGLCFSPDQTRLYIADSGGPHHIRVFDVMADNTLGNSRVFAVITPGVPDGMRVDATGRLFSSAGDGVQIFSPDGILLGKVRTPETAANVCFGGANNEMLFITASTSLYGITRMPDLVVTGIRSFPNVPVTGQNVIFNVIVKNQGTAPTPAGVATRVALTIDVSTNIVWSDGFAAPIPPAASVVLTCNGGVNGAAWTALEGTHTVRAKVDDLSRFLESNRNNNTFNATVSVAARPPDTDGDGLDDPSETFAGTDPQNIDSVLRILSSRRDGPDGIVLTWPTVGGKSYHLSSKGRLTDPSWNDVSGNISATGDMITWTQRVSNPVAPAFYRIRVAP